MEVPITRTIAALFVLTGSSPLWGLQVINEIRSDQPGADMSEFVEIAAPPGTSLDGITYVVIGDGGGGLSGVIDFALDLTGQTVPADGLFVAAESTFDVGTFGAVVDLTAVLGFENNDNVTHLLVTGFSGAPGDDLDLDNDGMLETEPWTGVMDRIALVHEPNPPLSTEFHYGPPFVGPAAAGAPPHLSLIHI